uniref:Thioesterase domain-containing protein n=1 Tax=Chenopodium quinoa TaxID=63459 RepID=A0A803M9E8_CHEQI
MNTANTLHGGAIAFLVDLVGSAVVFTVGAPSNSVSVEVNVSYLDTALPDSNKGAIDVIVSWAIKFRNFEFSLIVGA